MEYRPLSEDELLKLAELQELQKRKDHFEKLQAQKEAKAERDRFNAKCKSVFGLSKKQIEDRLKSDNHDDLEALVERLRIALGKDADWSFEKFVARTEQKANERTAH